LKLISQEKNPTAYQKKTAHDIDDPHVSSYLIKDRKERIESQRGKKKRNSQAYRIVSQQQNPLHNISWTAAVRHWNFL
jgi:hypothetical protein